MKYYFKTFFIFFLFILTSCSSIEYESLSIEESFQLAKRNNKKVFVIIGNNDCKKCEKLIKSLNRNKTAKKVFKDDFICLKFNCDDSLGKELSQITGCAFFPYSCFFDNEGNLLSLRVSQDKFDFNNIEQNKVNDYLYRELFKIPIPYNQFKERVSNSLKAYLQLKSKNSNFIRDTIAFNYAKKSVLIHPYPYNINFMIKLKMENGDSTNISFLKKLFKDNYI